MCAVTTPYDVILKHAETIPGHTAPTFGDALWSYADLAEQAGRIAGGLRDIGLGRGDRLAALAGNRPEVAVAWLAGSRLSSPRTCQELRSCSTPVSPAIAPPSMSTRNTPGA
jgi:acyl-CoA synthetase (AMP-forming)/AMP-acid ligase II